MSSETDPLLPKHADYPPSPKTETYSQKDASSPPPSHDPRNPIPVPHSNHPRRPSSSSNDPNPQDLEPLRPADFYELIGMRPPRISPSPSPDNNTTTLEEANGFYATLCAQTRAVERQYRIYDTLILTLLIAQIMLSATFIILGALDVDSHIAIALLGAAGSVIAGVLALMRTQGLPSRVRMERDALRRCVWEAEALYWDVGAGRGVTYEDVRRVREGFEGVEEEAGRRRPDLWDSVTVAQSRGLGGSGGVGRGVVAGRYAGRRVS